MFIGQEHPTEAGILSYYCRPPVSETLQAKKRYRDQQRTRAQKPSGEKPARGPPPPSFAALGELAAQQGSARRAASGQPPADQPRRERQPPAAAAPKPAAPEPNWWGEP